MSRLEAVVPSHLKEIVSVSLSVVAAQWNNSQRYYSVELLRAEYRRAQLDRGVKGDIVKELTRRTVAAAFEVVSIGEAQWNRSSRRSKLF